MTMRVLVTRPEPFTGRSAEKLRAAGHQPVAMPISEIVDSGIPLPAGKFDATILTSAAAAWVLAQRGLPVIIASRPCYCVGAATAKAARAAGFRDVSAGRAGVEELCAVIAERFDRCGASILYLQGRDISIDPHIWHQIANIAVSPVELYAVELIDPIDPQMAEALRDNLPDWAFLYSKRTARHFFQVMPGDIARAINYVAISAEVAAIVPDRLKSTVLAAETPTEAAMIACISRPKA